MDIIPNTRSFNILLQALCAARTSIPRPVLLQMFDQIYVELLASKCMINTRTVLSLAFFFKNAGDFDSFWGLFRQWIESVYESPCEIEHNGDPGHVWKIRGEESLDRTCYLLMHFRNGIANFFPGYEYAVYLEYLDLLVEEAGQVDVYSSRALMAMEYFSDQNFIIIEKQEGFRYNGLEKKAVPVLSDILN